MRTSIALALVGFALIVGAEAAQDIDAAKRLKILPHIRAASDCIAREYANEEDKTAALRQMEITYDPYSASAVGRCGFALRDMIYAHDRIYGAGTGEQFYKGPYLQDVRRAVLARSAQPVANVAGKFRACRLDGAELVASAVGNPPFDGKRYRVVKLMSQFDRLKSPTVNDWKPDGFVAAVIEGNGQRFIINQTYGGWGIPPKAAYSHPATDAAVAKIDTKTRAFKAERVRVDGTFDILNGPLENVSLRPLNCS